MGGSTQPMNTAQTYAAGCAGLKRRVLVDHEHGSICLRAVTLPLRCKLGIGIVATARRPGNLVIRQSPQRSLPRNLDHIGRALC